MELSRRDAVAALAAVGTGAGAVAVGTHLHESDPGEDGDLRRAMVAAAEVVYPDAVSGVDEFVETFLDGRLDDEAHAAGVREAVDILDDYASARHDASFTDLSIAERDDLLRAAGVATASENPDGTEVERIRYYVVNELLLALYASPAGGELVGIENPPGHPGGTGSYQRGPTP
ncbi:gluconate 2-dehydrogenase subunit 3 family protein [Halovivax cerinus]|uniref:Gluconate 2-dehydrogenase subunit 3 family protein n=1 Tax=Halovivax cerinus TaxID=1487865 RepID=A0ABD5NKP4_9EURY|nr:gluconate 2-dehydrogenase subunit 3 family protein [Halovivax cerinus]